MLSTFVAEFRKFDRRDHFTSRNGTQGEDDSTTTCIKDPKIGFLPCLVQLLELFEFFFQTHRLALFRRIVMNIGGRRLIFLMVVVVLFGIIMINDLKGLSLTLGFTSSIACEEDSRCPSFGIVQVGGWTTTAAPPTSTTTTTSTPMILPFLGLSLLLARNRGVATVSRRSGAVHCLHSME